MTKVGILLAAGTSRRYGIENKLLAPLRGRPLIRHAASSMAGAGLDQLIAVVADRGVAAQLADFQHVWVDSEDSTQSGSLRAGVAAAANVDADLAIVVLGDMPSVAPSHLVEVVNRCQMNSPSATTDGTRAMVPACFPRSTFDSLMRLEGDVGAQDLLRDLPVEALVYAEPAQLHDIDFVRDLIGD